MALSDSFRKVAVYFGLAEDREYYDDDEPDAREPERELESRYQERPNVRRLQSRRRRDWASRGARCGPPMSNPPFPRRLGR